MEHAVYLSGIKKALRARNETYADLAAHLKMTESGVKKMLNAKDISFRRVLQICDALEVLPGQLFSLSERSAIPVLHLTEEQQDALIKDRNLLIVYWRFTIEKLGIEEIAHLHGFKSAELKKALQRLATIGLLTERKGRFVAKHRGKYRWSDESKLAKLLNREWSQLTLARALKSQPRSDAFHRLIAIKLSKETYRDLLRKLSTALDEAVQSSEREELTISRTGLQDFTALVATTKGSVFSSIEARATGP